MARNYTNIPNELFDDLQDGKLTHKMFCVLLWLHRRADYKSGRVIKVSSARIRGEMWGDELEGDIPSERTIQEAIKRLHHSGYIQNHHIEGRRGTYAVDINNYSATIKKQNGETASVVVNPMTTVYWRDLPEFRGKGSGESACGDRGGETAETVRGDCGDPSAYTSDSSPSSGSSSSPHPPIETSVSESGSVCAPLRSATLLLDVENPEREQDEFEVQCLDNDEPDEEDASVRNNLTVSDSTCCAGASCPPASPLGHLALDLGASPENVKDADEVETEISPMHIGSGEAIDLCSEWIGLRSDVWHETPTRADYESVWFDMLLRQGHKKWEVLSVMKWLPRSNYWGKPGKGHFDTPEGFVCAYPTLLKQSTKFRQALARGLKKKQQGKAFKARGGDYVVSG